MRSGFSAGVRRIGSRVSPRCCPEQVGHRLLPQAIPRPRSAPDWHSASLQYPLLQRLETTLSADAFLTGALPTIAGLLQNLPECARTCGWRNFRFTTFPPSLAGMRESRRLIRGVQRSRLFGASNQPAKSRASSGSLTPAVTRLQFRDDLRQRQALYLKQQRGVKQQIRRLADDLAVGLRDRRQGQFQTFFADLLRDAGESRVDEFLRCSCLRAAWQFAAPRFVRAFPKRRDPERVIAVRPGPSRLSSPDGRRVPRAAPRSARCPDRNRRKYFAPRESDLNSRPWSTSGPCCG